ncbi:MAG: CU044_5270 family protein [Aeromicrobium sp.]
MNTQTPLDPFETALLAELRRVVQQGSARRHRGRDLLAAAAVLAVVGLGATWLLPSDDSNPLAPREAAAATVLTQAAEAAADRPAGQGIYWHTSMVRTYPLGDQTGGNGRVDQAWVRKDGIHWFRYGDGPIKRDPESQGFRVCDKGVDYEALAALPAEPTELRAALARLMRNNDDGPVPSDAQQAFVTACTVDLLSLLPVSPAVRAAGFRSLIAQPGAKNLGPAVDGRGRHGTELEFPDGDDTLRVILDPTTGLLLQSESGTKGNTARTLELEAGWTNTLG